MSDASSSTEIDTSFFSLMTVLRSPDILSAAGYLEPKRSVSLPISHVQQVDVWDCGLACVSMVLGSLGIRKRYQTLCALCRTTSIWSVDLAHVLALCGAKVTLSTIYPGANPSYGDGKIPYYESFTRDYKRVETLFQTAHQVGITICHSSITIEQLQIILCSGKYLIIALIDSRKLIAPSVNSSNHVLYSGHYVVLHGWDGVEQCFQVKDPSLGPQSRCMSVQQFEAARKAYGTDEDLIFVEISAAPQ